MLRMLSLMEAFPALPTSSFNLALVGGRSSFTKIHRKSFNLLKATESDEEDDGGWGTKGSDAKRLATAQEKELAALRSEMASKREEPAAQTSTSGTDRDLFIPIFAVVSLAGLFGAYGYEILRLQSRGELYLPWNN